MKRTWITGLTIVGIAGTGGAAFAGMSNDAPLPPPFSGDTQQATDSTAATPPEHTTYQIGPVGTVTVERDGGVLKIERVTIGDGWSLVATSVPGAHIGAQFTDSLQLVTFSADLVDGQVVVRPMMYLAVSYDHRIIDGREAVSFLVRIKECVEDPERVLLEV